MFKGLILGAIFAAIGSTQDICPAARLNECENDLEKAYEACEEAAKEKGQDQQADINCVKYFTVMRKECWPCVCKYAEQYSVHIRGCDNLQFE